jgi:hypothetical protein
MVRPRTAHAFHIRVCECFTYAYLELFALTRQHRIVSINTTALITIPVGSASANSGPNTDKISDAQAVAGTRPDVEQSME